MKQYNIPDLIVLIPLILFHTKEERESSRKVKRSFGDIHNTSNRTLQYQVAHVISHSDKHSTAVNNEGPIYRFSVVGASLFIVNSNVKVEEGNTFMYQDVTAIPDFQTHFTFAEHGWTTTAVSGVEF